MKHNIESRINQKGGSILFRGFVPVVNIILRTVDPRYDSIAGQAFSVFSVIASRWPKCCTVATINVIINSWS